MNVRTVPTRLAGPVLIEAVVHNDEHGSFQEVYRRGTFAELGIADEFVEDNHARLRRGTVRGMHFQPGRATLVRCSHGAIHDVLVDVRPKSDTFGHWEAFGLSDSNHRQLYVPAGFAHGFAVVSAVADVVCKATAYYVAELERVFAYDDPEVAISWPDGIELSASPQDRDASSLAAIAGSTPGIFDRTDHEAGSGAAPGERGVSEVLRRFTGEMVRERRSILDFVIDVASETAHGTSVLDLGAGDAPYRELFAHARYVTSDWIKSVHPGARAADVIASADALPLADNSFGLVLCTQVLEHVPEPSAVLHECFRLLAPGGTLALTVPLLWELHELPYDYYRYTEPGVRYLLGNAGFTSVKVNPRSDGFTAIAQLLENLSWAMGDADDGRSAQRIEARGVLAHLAQQLDLLAPLDARRIMPLGYSALARKP
jgi:dTDP-4-dehydrorhamnose 3,5-epimerase